MHVARAVRVYVRTISAPCAHPFGELCRSTDGQRDSIMIQAHYGSKHLMAFRTDVPAMAVRHFQDQASYVQSLQHPTDRVALTRAFADILDRSVERLSDVGVAKTPKQVIAIEHRLEQS